MAKIIFFSAFIFNLLWLLSDSVILLCRAAGKNQIILGGADSPTSVILEIPSAVPSWQAAAVLACGLSYLMFSIYMYMRLKG